MRVRVRARLSYPWVTRDNPYSRESCILSGGLPDYYNMAMALIYRFLRWVVLSIVFYISSLKVLQLLCPLNGIAFLDMTLVMYSMPYDNTLSLINIDPHISPQVQLHRNVNQ